MMDQFPVKYLTVLEIQNQQIHETHYFNLDRYNSIMGNKGMFYRYSIDTKYTS